MDAFARLTPALQYQIVNGLGWSSLRPVQEMTIEAVLDGANCVVLAPTAGGKTEASLFPLLSMMDTESWLPVSVLYVAPLRALLNNQEARLQSLTGLLGRRAFKWHGDVPQSQRRRFIRDPADIIAVTPESLEAMLISPNVPTRRLFANLQAVVIDEVHAFAASERGGHLVAVLERLTYLTGRDIQRIGLSATVGNPADICRWLAGSSQRPQQVVDPPRSEEARADLKMDYVGSLSNAALMIDRLHRGAKRLVFVDSRRRVEELGHLLAQRDIDVHVTHSSLAASEREQAERAFEEGHNCVIVATSALELGIDVGDLDYVVQIEAPSTVAAFLQRMGRTGRRPGTHPNCTFLVTKEEYIIEAAALLRLYNQEYVEPVQPLQKASHLLAHQIMALGLQEQGIPVLKWWDWIKGASVFAGLKDADRRELLEHMLTEEILAEVDGRYILGRKGEKRYGRRHFMDLYAVFSAPPVFQVMWGSREIGTIDLFFVLQRDEATLSFFLGGKAWSTDYIDWDRGICFVQPAPAGTYPSWLGRPYLLSFRFCQAIREVLVDNSNDPWWSRRACDAMQSMRVEYSFLHDATTPFIREHDKIRWWTFAGGRANNLLARMLEHALGPKVRADNLCLTFTEQAGQSTVKLQETIRQFNTPGVLSEQTAKMFADSIVRGRLSKFQPCLSERLELEFLAEMLTDLEGASWAVGAALHDIGSPEDLN